MAQLKWKSSGKKDPSFQNRKSLRFYKTWKSKSFILNDAKISKEEASILHLTGEVVYLQVYYFVVFFRPEKQGKLQEIPGTLKVIILKTSPEQPLQSKNFIEWPNQLLYVLHVWLSTVNLQETAEAKFLSIIFQRCM